MALSQSRPSSTTSLTNLPHITTSSHLISLEPSASVPVSSTPAPTLDSTYTHTRSSPASIAPADFSSLHGSRQPSSNNSANRQSTFSNFSTKQNRTGLFTLAQLARDKTTSAIASLSEPAVRNRPSYGSLNRLQYSPALSSGNTSRSGHSQSNYFDPQIETEHPTSSSHTRSDTLTSLNTRQLLETNPPSQAYSDTAADTPPTISHSANHNKMHQTSSRLLRMTNDDRPFTRVSETAPQI